MMMMLEHASTHKTHAYLPVFFLFIIRLRLYSTSLPDFKSLPKLGSNNCSCEVSECEWCTLQFKFNDTYKRSSQKICVVSSPKPLLCIPSVGTISYQFDAKS